VSGLAVQLRGLGVAYGRREVLRDLDVTIRAGEQVALVGPNGAGKSTLLRCLTGAVGRAGDGARLTGSVMLDSVPLDELSRRRLAGWLSVVPGEAPLPFSMRVEEVVALGRIPHEHPLLGPGPTDREAVEAALERVGITRLRGRDARRLSLGERQLVLLAMAVAQGGRLLILDEPTVHLDLRHQVAVMELLRDLHERDGLTILAVLHDLPLAAHFFERLLLLDAGRIVADGRPADVLTAERIRSVYGVDERFVRTSAR
jgi:ABC-type cobalamin/Fe3+-siderophores transport system ATPase subunit